MPYAATLPSAACSRGATASNKSPLILGFPPPLISTVPFGTGQVERPDHTDTDETFAGHVVVLVNHSLPLSIASQYTFGSMDFFKIQALRRALVLSQGNEGITLPP